MKLLRFRKLLDAYCSGVRRKRGHTSVAALLLLLFPVAGLVGCTAEPPLPLQLEVLRLAPGDGGILLEWKPPDLEIPAALSYRVEIRPAAGGAGVVTLRAGAPTASVTSLENGLDYQIQVFAESEESNDVVASSAVRLARPGPVPGIVVDYLHPEDGVWAEAGRYIGSPSLAILPDGRYVSSHDIFGGGGSHDRMRIFRSSDRGTSWRHVSDLSPTFWPKLFVQGGQLYCLAVETQYGSLVIFRSEDGGAGWSPPTTLLEGPYHKAPMPLVEKAGRLWTAIEKQTGDWPGGFQSGVISVPSDADLMEADNWVATPPLPYDHSWPGALSEAERPGFLEGNIVVGPAGQLLNLLRYNTTPAWGKAILLEVDGERPDGPQIFRKVIDFPGGMTKFHIRFDPESGRYWALSNPVTRATAHQRNVLALVSSSDVLTWEIESVVLDYSHRDVYSGDRHDLKIGFQYVDWAFDGDDIVAVSRTALNGANNYHDANYLTFHRLQDFRSLRQHRLDQLFDGRSEK